MEGDGSPGSDTVAVTNTYLVPGTGPEFDRLRKGRTGQGAGNGFRGRLAGLPTYINLLGSCRSTIELHPQRGRFYVHVRTPGFPARPSRARGRPVHGSMPAPRVRLRPTRFDSPTRTTAAASRPDPSARCPSSAPPRVRRTPRDWAGKSSSPSRRTRARGWAGSSAR